MLQKSNPKNDNIQVFIKDKLYPRSEAKVSVFDSSVQGGDAVWEGLRVYPEGVVCLDKHLTRLQESAKTLAFVDIPSKKFIKKAIKQTLDANGMNDDTHIRLTLTRGEKITSGMDPRLNQSGSCLIVLAEWKPLVYDNDHGIKVISTSQRRNSPQFLDSKIHHNNLLNNIIAKIQANVAGKDAGLMLDDRGFIAELNGSNLFMVKNEKVVTPFAHACLPGITRNSVIEMCKKHDIEISEADITLSQFYNADGVFATGTMGELTPVVEIDGRSISKDDSLQKKIISLFKKEVRGLCEKLD
ncbi:aminotransferase class IV [Aequorivita vladivostokensis]|uniref:branched-chain-amino-acid transaminase n=1 Tax=Aequorivita vladivostokensis TaxID=171194 RepID=A0ABR5DG46_9FLAO|nr:aminotransferase class IV [Aequorivita vladivostokensis]KJJ37709.1 aminotransferase IV [Aequorivita vladivostokensis]MAB57162.1 aminotransferase IV [Aequorivita sp.]MBF31644.1 aminotransferase IV [Aequorivita sp.]|tara:strand:+ start:96182 stop:97078 length:897 start_codon:yes stop_codon:yes gene_type:complete